MFSEGDQCLPLADPLTTLFDQIEVAGAIAPEAQYLLRRLAVSLGPNADAAAFSGLARRTFGFYQRFMDSSAAADAWLVQRRVTLTSAIQATAEPPALPWEEELAAKTGATRGFIAVLAKAYAAKPGRRHQHGPAAGQRGEACKRARRAFRTSSLAGLHGLAR